MKRDLIWEDFPFSEADLRAGARAASQTITDALPQDCPHTFSPEFQRNMDRLIRKTDRSGWTVGLQRAACFFLALLLSGTAWLTVDAQAREVVFGWISEHVIDAQRYFYQGEVTATEDVVHYQIDIPEGYWLKERLALKSYVNEYYVNKKGEFISFSYLYQTETSGGEMYIDDTESERKKATVHGISADLYLATSPEDSNTVVWMDPETGALFDVTACMEEDNLIKLAESVMPIKK